MRRCFEMHIRPKRCKRDTASWPGPQAGGDVISFVLREMQGPARGVDSRVILRTAPRRRGIASTPSRRPRHARSIVVPRLGPNGFKFEKETSHDLLSQRRRASMA